MRWQRASTRLGNALEWLFTNTTCRAGYHSRPGHRVFKFNGGRGAWLCRWCRLILAYGQEDK